MFLNLFIYINLASLVSGEKGDTTVNQKPHNLIIKYGESPEIKCFHKIPNYDRLLWYKQSQSKELTFMGNLIGDSGYPEKAFQNKITISGDSNKFHGSLTLINSTSENSAVYFCAAYRQNMPAYFGNGTKLTVLESNINIKKPDVKILNETSCKEKVTLVCLAENFYPDHVNITWILGSNEIKEDVATDPYATQNGTTRMFSISSRLKVPKKQFKPQNIFYCKVTFYTATDVFEHIYAEITGIGGSGYEPEDYLKSSQSMKLAYSVFIAKSALYGLVILVFVWRKGSSGKRIN